MAPKILTFILLSFFVVTITGITLAKEKKVKTTIVSIKGDKFLVNCRPAYKGIKWQGHSIEGLFMNSRMVQGIFDDTNPATAGQLGYQFTPQKSIF